MSNLFVLRFKNPQKTSYSLKNNPESIKYKGILNVCICISNICEVEQVPAVWLRTTSIMQMPFAVSMQSILFDNHKY